MAGDRGAQGFGLQRERTADPDAFQAGAADLVGGDQRAGIDIADVGQAGFRTCAQARAGLVVHVAAIAVTARIFLRVGQAQVDHVTRRLHRGPHRTHGLGGARVVTLQVLAAIGAGLQQVLRALKHPFHTRAAASVEGLHRQRGFQEAAGARGRVRVQADRGLHVAEAEAADVAAEEGLAFEAHEHVQPGIGLEVVIDHRVVGALLLQRRTELLAAHGVVVLKATARGEIVVVVGDVGGSGQLGAVAEGVLGRPVVEIGSRSEGGKRGQRQGQQGGNRAHVGCGSLRLRVDRTTTAARAGTFAMTRPAVQLGPPASP